MKINDIVNEGIFSDMVDGAADMITKAGSKIGDEIQARKSPEQLIRDQEKAQRKAIPIISKGFFNNWVELVNSLVVDKGLKSPGKKVKKQEVEGSLQAIITKILKVNYNSNKIKSFYKNIVNLTMMEIQDTSTSIMRGSRSKDIKESITSLVSVAINMKSSKMRKKKNKKEKDDQEHQEQEEHSDLFSSIDVGDTFKFDTVAINNKPYAKIESVDSWFVIDNVASNPSHWALADKVVDTDISNKINARRQYISSGIGIRKIPSDDFVFVVINDDDDEE